MTNKIKTNLLPLRKVDISDNENALVNIWPFEFHFDLLSDFWPPLSVQI